MRVEHRAIRARPCRQDCRDILDELGGEEEEENDCEDAALELALGWGTTSFTSRVEAVVRRCWSRGRLSEEEEKEEAYWVERRVSRDYKEVKDGVLLWCVTRLSSSSHSTFFNAIRSRWILSSSSIDDDSVFLKRV